MKKHLFCISLLFISSHFFSQVGINTSTPTKTLDVNGDIRVRALPDASIGSYNIIVVDTDGNISTSNIDFSVNTVGDIKKGFQTADHQGWYLLDGRAVSALPANAQTGASSIGITTNIPDAKGRFLKTKTGTEALGSLGGSNNKNLLQTNLPNYNFSGSSSAAGNHSHTWTDTYNGGAAHGAARANPGVNNQWIPNEDRAAATSTDGNHSHSVTVNSEGSGQAFSILPQNVTVNTFIYLGN